MSDAKTGSNQTAVRAQVARWVGIVTTVFAVVLLLGIVLAVFADNVNEDNFIASLLLNFSEFVDGPFSREGGIFSFTGDGAATKSALANWGLAALAWLVVGRLLGRVIDR